jgi:hypothetical protein
MNEVPPSTPSNTKELRAFLLRQMGLVATGTQRPDAAKAICNYAQQIYNTVNLEMKYATAKAKAGENPIGAVEFDR